MYIVQAYLSPSIMIVLTAVGREYGNPEAVLGYWMIRTGVFQITGCEVVRHEGSVVEKQWFCLFERGVKYCDRLETKIALMLRLSIGCPEVFRVH